MYARVAVVKTIEAFAIRLSPEKPPVTTSEKAAKSTATAAVKIAAGVSLNLKYDFKAFTMGTPTIPTNQGNSVSIFT